MDLTWERGSSTLSWDHAGHRIVKEYARPLRSAAFIPSPPSVVVVEDAPSGWSKEPIRNATVYEPDGSTRVLLEPPPLPPDEPSSGFDQCFYDGHAVVAVYVTYHRGLIWGPADLESGRLGATQPFR